MSVPSWLPSWAWPWTAICQHIDDLASVVNFGALSSFLLLHIAVVHHYLIRQRSGQWLRHLLFPLAGFLVIAYVLYEMDRSAKIMGGCWIAIAWSTTRS